MLDTLGSFIIGGIVLALMTTVVITMQDTTSDVVMQEMSQLSLAEMSQTMERELTNLGYRVTDPRKVVTISNQSISFLSDYDNNGVVDTITYIMTRTRTGPIVTRRIAIPGAAPKSWTTRGSMVLFTAYDRNGAVTSDPASIRAVEASMLTSNVLYDKYFATSGGANSGSTAGIQTSLDQTQLLASAVDCQVGAYWHKTIYPRNLNVEPPQIAESGSETGTGTSQTGTGYPGNTDPGTGDPGNTDPGAGDPGGTDPGTTDPGSGGTVTPPADDPDPVIVPPANKNNPCPCGSGKKYKDCHGL
ncbi:MAG: SEC-C domain-containing protein [Bacteroidia bacterium]|nr:SEC-C domain-containing protein [Bacteroidia bacterium]